MKHTVTGFTPCRTSFPSLNVTSFSRFAHKEVHPTLPDSLAGGESRLSAHLYWAFRLEIAHGSGIGWPCYLRRRRAAHIRMSLFVFIGFVSCVFGFGLINLSFIGASIILWERVDRISTAAVISH